MRKRCQFNERNNLFPDSLDDFVSQLWRNFTFLSPAHDTQGFNKLLFMRLRHAHSSMRPMSAGADALDAGLREPEPHHDPAHVRPAPPDDEVPLVDEVERRLAAFGLRADDGIAQAYDALDGVFLIVGFTFGDDLAIERFHARSSSSRIPSSSPGRTARATASPLASQITERITSPT